MKFFIVAKWPMPVSCWSKSAGLTADYFAISVHDCPASFQLNGTLDSRANKLELSAMVCREQSAEIYLGVRDSDVVNMHTVIRWATV